MISGVKVMMKFDIDINDFYNQGSKNTVTQSIATFLGISPDRVRIVNIR